MNSLDERILNRNIQTDEATLEELCGMQHKLELQLTLLEYRESCRPPQTDGNGEVMKDAKGKPMRPEPFPETEQTRHELMVVTGQIKITRERYEALLLQKAELKPKVPEPIPNGTSGQ